MTWMQKHSGNRFDFANPRAEDIYIGDIAINLSRICRFNGDTKYYYSVAQHSIIVSLLAPPEHRKWGLMHDAAETYLGDVVRPFKGALWVFYSKYDKPIPFKEYENQILRLIAERFGLPWPVPPIIKEIDDIVQSTEADQLMPGGCDDWELKYDPLPDFHISCMNDTQANIEFNKFIECYSFDNPLNPEIKEITMFQSAREHCMRMIAEKAEQPAIINRADS